MSSEPLLVADIGGTNARFALFVREETGPSRIIHKKTLLAENFAHIADAAHAYLTSLSGTPPTRAAFAVAGPTGSEDFQFTNSPWSFNRAALSAALNLSDLQIVNDFEAQALGVLHLPQDALSTLKKGTVNSTAPIAVLGPGTGLGLSLLVGDNNDARVNARAIATEGGHMAFAPRTDKEIEVLQFIERELDYVSYEDLLSGRGLVNIHRALCALSSTASVELTPSKITEAALEKTSPIAQQTVEMFCAILGSFTGDIILACGAKGGVYIAGGITPRILPILHESEFEKRLTSRGSISAYVNNVPITVVMSDEAAFWGAASLL